MTIRPYRAIYTWGIAILSVMTFGWWVLLPLFLIQCDLTVTKR
jgi:hypothetical protein